MSTLQLLIVANSINTSFETGGFGYLPLNNSSAQWLIASHTGTLAYNELTSKLINTSSFSSSMLFNSSEIDFVYELIQHSSTTESQSATCFPILYYDEPGINKTGRNGVFYLQTFASPYNCGGLLPIGFNLSNNVSDI